MKKLFYILCVFAMLFTFGAAAQAASAAPSLSWDFTNTSNSGGISTSQGLSSDSSVITGSISQTGGGPAETWGTNTVFLTRFFGSVNYPYIQFTTTTPVSLDNLSFIHFHNHNYSFTTQYDVQLQIDTGSGFTNIGAPLTVNKDNSGQTAAISLGNLKLNPGTYRMRWISTIQGWADTNSDFFAIDNVTLQTKPVQTLVIAGANGTAGTTDPYTEFSMDNGQTWHQAYLYGSHPWGFVPGTNSWLNCAPNGQAPECLNRSVLYRISFQVPDDAVNANMQFDVKADNYASISLNGQHVADITGQDSPNVDASIAGAIQPGLNRILLNVTDTGGWAGLNYKITVTMNAAEAPVIVDPAPTATVSYTTTALTNGNVVATIAPSEPVTVTNNGGSESYTFSENGTFTFQFVDSAGNAGSATATVSNIDKVPPVITINPYNTNPTNQSITVTASTNEGTLNTVSHTFDENGTFTFTATDAAGNVTNKTVSISNIDKVAPFTTDDAPVGWQAKDVVVTLSASDVGSGVDSTYYTVDNSPAQNGNTVSITSEGTHSITYWSVDRAGNIEATKKVYVQIDKTAPTVKLTLDQPTLWPPNHKLVTIHANVDAQDKVSNVASVTLVSIVSNEPDRDVTDPEDQAGDIQNADYGTSDTTFDLRAERLGTGNGRVYTITYIVTDAAGNSSTATATVTVPHDQSATAGKSNSKK